MLGPVSIATAVALLGAFLSAAWLFYLGRSYLRGRDFPVLEPVAAPEPKETPRVSIIVAARNEEQELPGCIRSLLSQRFADCEIIAVDDRSSDRSAELLAEFAAGSSGRLRVVRVDSVPEGWGGQNHAIDRGVTESRGDWLCFTDADCRFDSDTTLRTALDYSIAEGVEFLSILPQSTTPTIWERLYWPLCSWMHLARLRLFDVNDSRSGAGYANGAFMLITRRSYEQIGGHRAVRDHVSDDVRLARVAKTAGIPVRVTGNIGLCSTRMYESLRASWRGWGRNTYGTQCEGHSLAATTAFTFAMFVLPHLLLAVTAGLIPFDPAWTPAAGTAGSAVALCQLSLWQLYRSFQFRPAWSLLSLPGALFLTALLTAATIKSMRRAGLVWHGVNYPHPTRLPRRRPRPKASRGAGAL